MKQFAIIGTLCVLFFFLFFYGCQRAASYVDELNEDTDADVSDEVWCYANKERIFDLMKKDLTRREKTCLILFQ